MLHLANQWHRQHGKLRPAFLQRKLQISYTKALEIVREIKENQVKN